MAADALAQLIFAPVIGYVADYFATIRPVIITCSIIFSFGNLMYSMISLIPQSFGNLKQARFVAMLVSRFIVGIGSGILDY